MKPRICARSIVGAGVVSELRLGLRGIARNDLFLLDARGAILLGRRRGADENQKIAPGISQSEGERSADPATRTVHEQAVPDEDESVGRADVVAADVSV